MKRSVSVLGVARTRIAGWLLCLVLAWLSFGAPHCELCDWPHGTVISSTWHPPLVHRAPVEPDACNGVCSCCEFHWAPKVGLMLSEMLRVGSASMVEVPLPRLTARSPILQPPRGPVSS